MASPIFVSSVIGLALMTVGLAQVVPSVSEAIYAKKIEVGIGREEALMQQIVRYRALEGVYPAAVSDLIDKGYWRAADNDNGFGSGYSFVVDSNKGLIWITTTIADDSKRLQYQNNYRHVFKPFDAGNGALTTPFVMATTGSMGAPLPTAGNIPVGASAPSAASNTYWYDTSGSSAVLKVSDGVTWTAATSGAASAPSASNIVSAPSALLTTGVNVGDVRYVYDASGNVLNTYVYYNGGWVLSGGGGAGYGADGVPDQFLFTPASLTGVTPGGQATSNTLTIAGVNSSALISATVTGGSAVECKINGSAWGACSGSAVNGTTIQMRYTTQLAFNAASSATLTVGGVNATLSATTAAASALGVSGTGTFSGTILTNTTPTQTITVTNSNVLAIGMAAAVTGDSAFSLSSNTCGSSLAGNGASCTLTVQFAPGSSTAAKTGTLALGNGQTVALSGQAVAPDSTPDAFSFSAATGVTPGATATSGAITVSGINTTASLSLSGTGASQQCSVNSGAWGSCPATVTNGQTVAVRHTTSSSYNTITTSVLTIGGVSATFSATTLAPLAMTVSPTSLSINGPTNTVSTGTLTLTNPNTFAVSLGLSITQSGTEFTGVSNNCAGSVAANNGTCTVTVSFNPGSSTSAISATLNLGFNAQTVSMTGQGTAYIASAGYAAKSYPNPSVGAAYSGTCATGFIPVPAMTIPTNVGTSQTIPAHCVMQYLASPSNVAAAAQSVMGGSYSSTFRATNVTYQPTTRAEGFTLTTNAVYKPKSDATGKPWVYISYYEAAAACNSMGTAPNGQQIRLQRESEWMAAAHNTVGVPANWTGGAVDNGDMYQGVNNNPAPYSTSGAQAASAGDLVATVNQRTKKLTNGQVIWDLGGNLYQWTYHDFTGGGTNGLFGNIVRNQTAAPYNSQTRGMGWIPDSNAGNASYTLPNGGWAGYAPLRGSRWSGTTGAGPFYLGNYTATSTGYDGVGFRCTHQ